MKTCTLLLAALAAAPFLCAQEDKNPAAPGGMQMPDPKTPQHDVLKAFVGSWQTTMKMEAMPGVPGMEKPQESSGTEHCELICNGLWLKATNEGTHDGKACQGLWLVGYDPAAKSYTGLWVSSMDEPSSAMTGSFDAAKKTWTFTGESPFGPYRSVLVWNDADTSTETCYLVADGKETKCMEMVRKRVSGGKPVDASANFTKPEAKEFAMLAEGVGTWDATVKSMMPGAPATEEKGTEKVVPICSGKWYWSDFKGTMMGAPFEGHGITGYEPSTKKYVSYWIDSMSPTFSRTEGDYDAAKKQFTMAGKCVGMDGQPMTIEQTSTNGPDSRVFKMVMKSAAMTHEMQIDFKRTKG